MKVAIVGKGRYASSTVNRITFEGIDTDDLKPPNRGRKTSEASTSKLERTVNERLELFDVILLHKSHDSLPGQWLNDPSLTISSVVRERIGRLAYVTSGIADANSDIPELGGIDSVDDVLALASVATDFGEGARSLVRALRAVQGSHWIDVAILACVCADALSHAVPLGPVAPESADVLSLHPDDLQSLRDALIGATRLLLTNDRYRKALALDAEIERDALAAVTLDSFYPSDTLLDTIRTVVSAR